MAPLSTMIDFAINQEEIAEEFCENKDKPELKCDGKCHLTKVLQDQSNEDDPTSSFQGRLEYPLGKISQLKLLSSFSNKVKVTYLSMNENLLPAFPQLIDYPPIG